jgi:D-3-phosphoglycerate dehydrogenase / 2-oxoglutarate reductase
MNVATHTILYGEPLPAELIEVAFEMLPDGYVLRVMPNQDRTLLRREILNADFLIVATTPIDAAILDCAARLRLIQHQGVGVDNIDLAAAARARVPVAINPEGTSVGVAEHVFLLMLALYKRLRALESEVQAGRWPVWAYRHQSFELSGKSLGLIGLGRIGREVAMRARAFDMKVYYYDVARLPGQEERRIGVTYFELGRLLRKCDIVSLHLPLTPQTRQLITKERLASMPAHAILINTARGGLVDEVALTEALSNGAIAGAGLDVLASEPPRLDDGLITMSNVVVTPHVAAGTRDAFVRKLEWMYKNIERVAGGAQPANLTAWQEGGVPVAD